MPDDYWDANSLRDAARLLKDAAEHLHTTYPHYPRRPNPQTLPAVKAMIDAALECVRHAQPEQEPTP